MTRRNFLQSTLILSSAFAFNACSHTKTDFTTLKIGYLPITDHLLVIAKEFGAEFTPIKFASWADLSEALRSQTIDGAFILTPLAFKLKTLGVDIKSLMAVHRNGSALVLQKGLVNGQNISALKGKKIAIPSRFSTHYLLFATLLKSAHLTPDDITLIDMAPTEMVFALKAKSIDGFIVAEPFGFIAQELELADMFILSKDIINNHICCVLALTQKTLESKKQETQRLVNAFVETATYIPKNLEASAKISEKFLGYKPMLIKNLLEQENRVIYQNLKLNPNDILQTLQSAKEFNIGDFQLDFDSFVDSSFIDSALKESA